MWAIGTSSWCFPWENIIVAWKKRCNCIRFVGLGKMGPWMKHHPWDFKQEHGDGRLHLTPSSGPMGTSQGPVTPLTEGSLRILLLAWGTGFKPGSHPSHTFIMVRQCVCNSHFPNYLPLTHPVITSTPPTALLSSLCKALCCKPGANYVWTLILLSEKEK